MLSLKLIKELMGLSKEDVSEAFDLLRARSRVLDAQSTAEFHVGQPVWFVGRRGMKHNGKVKGINRSTITVETEHTGTWRIPAGSLNAGRAK